MTYSKSLQDSGAGNPARIFFVNRFYSPDISATSQILTDVAEHLAADKHEIRVYTSRMSYDGHNFDDKRETLQGVEVHRVWSTRFGRQTILGRVCDYLSFYISVSINLLFSVKRDDILVAKTDPPMISVPLGIVARLKRGVLVNWLQDLFPEVAQNLGVGSRESPIWKLLKSIRNRSLSHARTNVVIGRRMREALEDLNVPSNQITIIGNFVDDDSIVPLPHNSPELRREWDLELDDFIVGYSGNLGRAHDLETVLNAASDLRALPDVKFLFVGGGHLHGRLKEQIDKRDLSNIVLKPYQPRARLPETLALPNLHWASLNPTLEGFIVPSKLYGIAAAGRPLLMVGAPLGEIGEFLNAHKFGACITPGDSDGAREFILSLKRDESKRAELGANARKFLEDQGSRQRALTQWDQLVSALRPQH